MHPHACPVEGCAQAAVLPEELARYGGTVVPHFMCLAHWRTIPISLRRTLVFLYGTAREPRPGYQEACENALLQVNALVTRSQHLQWRRRLEHLGIQPRGGKR